MDTTTERQTGDAARHVPAHIYMDGWMDGDRCRYKYHDRCWIQIDIGCCPACVPAHYTDGWMDGWMDTRTDRQTDRQLDRKIDRRSGT